MTGYGELAVTSNFSFLRGASHAADLVATAMDLGLAGIGIADENTVAGVVRAHAAVQKVEELWVAEHGPDIPLPFKLAVGSRLVFADGTPDILAYPQNRAGWARLCRLLTLGKRRAEKGECLLTFNDLLFNTADLLLIVMPRGDRAELTQCLQRLGKAAPGSLWLAASMQRRGDDRRRLAGLKIVARSAGVPLIAVNDVLYHAPGQRPVQDVLTCIREGTTLEAAGRRLEANAERHLKPPTEMTRLFADCPEAIEETLTFLDLIDFSLKELRYNYPDEPVPPGWDAQSWLEELVRRRVPIRYPDGVPEKVETLLAEEFDLIRRLDYARYFLTIHDIVRFAEDKGILCQGRGSAANSAVCYVLGITAVDPAEHDLLFARFLSMERKEPPDIDVDFEHERREEVIQHIYARYGRERAAIAATVISYRPRSAIREVGKVLGLTEDVTQRLAGTVWGSYGSKLAEKHIREAGLEPDNPLIARAVDLATRILGFPRHLSQHVGGFVLTRERLDDLVPIGNAAMEDRTFIEWDKDDIDTLGLLKVDVLALGMLTCIRKGFDLLRAYNDLDLGLADVEREDEAVYGMLQKGDSIGVFQVESRAQINMLPRLRPKEFYDLVIQVAIVRPGPIQGDMVHPYLRRRKGEEKVDYPAPAPEHGPADELRKVLARTLGVPLFQEQAMKIAMVAAKFTSEEANQLRRAMATFRHVGTIHTFEAKMVEGMVRRGYTRDFAQRCFDQIKGFGEYGFPESHAASFAKLVYVSAWIKCHHPAVFACALLNSQPMGFYAPAQIVRDAREHGVPVHPADVNVSGFDNTLEREADGRLALRLGLRQISGFREDWADTLAEARGDGFRTLEDLWSRARLPRAALDMLADADGFRSLGLDRREAMWAVRRLPDDEPLPLFAASKARELAEEPAASLPEMALAEHVVADYQTTHLSLKAHPMQFLRRRFRAEGILSSSEVRVARNGSRVSVAGLVLVRQRPGKGNAIFMTLEDETGIVNVLIWARRFEQYRREVMGARLAVVRGELQLSEEGVIHVIADAVADRSADLNSLGQGHEASIQLSRADEVLHPVYPRVASHPRNVRLIPKSRDFH
ncbi:Error-prone DNA polymerase [Hartmannibacter diazotrophicus]|uniref:Error-prone DNA polymerase n=1 Tax=Hartmannibacter diazotrophicus TaxID=1482074 RepID=A0A2C9D0W3_9HYPH|nr:error-prone DNA polymerase [Hartmannibacter diazotrophicus]SON53863.1 Error-prone DNA polymerase [Hartmannibacter diazotrophicus]